MANPSSLQQYPSQDGSDSVALLQLLQCLQQPSQQQTSMNSLFQDTLLQALQQIQQNPTQAVQQSDHLNLLGELQSQSQKIISEQSVQHLTSSSPKQSSVSSSSVSQGSMMDTAISNSQQSITNAHHENQSPSLAQDLSNEADLFSFIQSYLTLEQLMQAAQQNPSQTAPFVQALCHQGEQAQGQDSADENSKSEKQHSHLLSTPSNVDKLSGGSNSKSSNISHLQQKPLISAHQSSALNLNESFDTQAMLSTHKKGFSRHQNSSNSSFAPRAITYEGQNTSAQNDIPNQSYLLTQDNFLSSMDPTTVLSLSALLSQQGGFTMAAAVAALEAADLLRLQEQKRLERAYKIERYKNKRRNWIRKISYDCRKRVADSRLRVKGRFISKKDTQTVKTQDESSFPAQDNNNSPKNQSCVPNMNNTGFDCLEQAQQLNQQQSQYIDKPIQDETLAQSISSCELTCAAASNFSISLKPESMDKIKSRISKKKQIFKLCSSSPIFKTTSQYLLNPIHCNSFIDSIIPSQNHLVAYNQPIES